MSSQLHSILKTATDKRALIYGNTIVVGLAALISVFVAPQRYTAQAVLMPSMDEGTLVLIGGNLSASGGMATLLSGGMLTTPSDIYLDLMNSRSVRESLITRLDLMKYYHSKNMDEALLALESHLSTTAKPSGMIVIEYTDKDPKLATDAVNQCVQLLDEFNKRIIITKGTKMRVFLEKRLQEIKDSTNALADTLVKLQTKYGTLGMDEEVAGMMNTYAQLKGQLIAKQYMLQAMLPYASEKHPDVIALKRDIASLRSQLARMEKTGAGGFGPGFGIGLDSLPEAMVNIQIIQQELETQGAIFEVLAEEYEKAKLLEKRDAPTIQIVDPARVPQKRSWPKRSIFLIASVIGALVFGWAAAIYGQAVQNLLQRENDPFADLVRTVSKDLSFWKRRGKS